MLRLMLLAVVSLLLFSSMGATQASAQADALPTVDAAGVIAPLSIDQLDPAERARFESLAAGSDDARRFLYTRGYLRYSRLVVDGLLAPLELPRLPPVEDWDNRFFSEEERVINDAALAMKLIARMQPPAQ